MAPFPCLSCGRFDPENAECEQETQFPSQFRCGASLCPKCRMKADSKCGLDYGRNCPLKLLYIIN
jgi:hypothetical protein